MDATRRVGTDAPRRPMAGVEQERRSRDEGAPRSSHAVALTILVVILTVAATLVVAAAPSIDFAYRAPAVHIAIEACIPAVAVLAAYLVFGRYAMGGRLRDLALLGALGVLMLTSLL